MIKPQVKKMAAINQEMFRKFKQLSTRQDADGTEVEVREDEEQGVKLQEIIDILVAAGYFRARIKGLSPFDKVVGGMTWCIESCNVDVDVDLLFQENSTIGQKIALTEKIVAVLPKLKCPHAIEPHQIQGLDFIHIFPVIQWLVKRSMEYRQERAAFVHSYAINQYHKAFAPPNKQPTGKTEQIMCNINSINEVYRPRRCFKRKTGPPADFSSQVQVTLLEYGMRGKMTASKSTESEEVEEQESNEQIDRILNVMAEISDADTVLYDELNLEDREKLAKHYMALHSELQDGGLKSREMEKLLVLQKQNELISDHCRKLEGDKASISANIKQANEELQEIKSRLEETRKSLKEIEEATDETADNVKEVEDLVILNDNLRTQELQFREHCKKELSSLHVLIEETKKAKTPVVNDELNEQEVKEAGQRLKAVRLQLAKKNRTIVSLQRQLDDVPSRAELAQYQRRFLELYNQVASKHKETKQYYTLYNTLEDTRRYMKTEISLLNSISDSYPTAMQTSAGKEEFLKQFESIIENVKSSRAKVDKRLNEERRRRDQLTYKMQALTDLQRKYAAAVKQLSIECRKHENFAQ